MNFLSALLFVLMWLDVAWASEAHAASIHEIWFPLINFLIFLYLIKRFAVPVARDHFRTRHEDIRRSVTEAAAAKDQAESRAQQYRDRLAVLKEEVKRIHEAFTSEGEREKERMLRDAETQAAKVKADADFLVGQEMKVAQAGLLREIAHLARASAERIIRSHFTHEDDKRLADEFVAKLGGSR
jgi:F-type H+-transporting ATPase subunit b